jgi:hypothetical protein
MDRRFSAILFRDLYFLYSFYLETVIADRWYHGVRFFCIAGDLFAAVYCLINAFVNATNSDQPIQIQPKEDSHR